MRHTIRIFSFTAAAAAAFAVGAVQEDAMQDDESRRIPVHRLDLPQRASEVVSSSVPLSARPASTGPSAALPGQAPACAPEAYAALSFLGVESAGAETRIAGDVGTVRGRSIAGLAPGQVDGRIRDGGCGEARERARKAFGDLDALIPTGDLPTDRNPALPVDLRERLVSSWLFEEESGTLLGDQTGANPLQVGPGVTLGGSIGQGRCISVNGVAGEGELRIAGCDQTGLDFGTGDFAVECWVKLDRPQTQVFPADAYVVAKYDRDARRGLLMSVYRHTDQTHAYFKVDLGVGWNLCLDGGIEFDAAERHQLLVVRENGILRTYVDGVPDAMMNVSNGGSMDSDADFAVGGWPGVNSNYEGPVDTVRVWKRALNTSEISSLYALGCEDAPPEAPAALRILPGVYACPDSLRLSGEVVLEAGGDPEARFVFQVPGDLTMIAGAMIRLEGGADANRVFWVVERNVTLERSVHCTGTLIAGQGDVRLEDGAELLGRVWALEAGVRMDRNRVETP